MSSAQIAALILLQIIGHSLTFEVKVPKLYEPPRVVVRKLYEDPNYCHQMTWDRYWGDVKPRFCRGGSCYRPFFNGFDMPNITFANSSRICPMSKGESCIKVAIYDDFDKSTPTYVSRYCGSIITTDGDKLTNRCLRTGNTEVCSCRDQNKCNAASSVNLGSILYLIIPSILLKLLPNL